MNDVESAPGELFSLRGKVAIVTGGLGLLGRSHRSILTAAGATAISLDVTESGDDRSVVVDITSPTSVAQAVDEVVSRYGQIDILVNNAANNPKVETESDETWSRFENFSCEMWNADLAVGLSGAFLMCQAVGPLMAAAGSGVILNICSDLAVISPDQRLYRKDGIAEDRQPVKPVSYSVVKHGLVGLTRYLSTYWADRNVRVNALSPGGVENGQDSGFVKRLENLIPLGRMAHRNEYEGAVLFLCSDASSYMTGHNLVIDGGRTVW